MRQAHAPWDIELCEDSDYFRIVGHNNQIVASTHDEDVANFIVLAPEMLALLEELEWCENTYYCPICGQEPERGGHNTECKLGNLLAKVRGK